MRAAVRPGVTTAELDAVAAREMERVGARSAPSLVYGFPGWTCISVNEEAVHGVPGDRVLEPGDLVTLDVTAELDGFMADAAVTVPLPPVEPDTRRSAPAPRRRSSRGCWPRRAGRPVSAIGRAVEAEVERRGFRVLRRAGRPWHRPHDPRAADRPQPRAARPARRAQRGAGDHDRADRLPSTRTALETADGWTVVTEDGSRAAHAEHTIVVRKGSPLLLTAA